MYSNTNHLCSPHRTLLSTLPVYFNILLESYTRTEQKTVRPHSAPHHCGQRILPTCEHNWVHNVRLLESVRNDHAEYIEFNIVPGRVRGNDPNKINYGEFRYKVHGIWLFPSSNAYDIVVFLGA